MPAERYFLEKSFYLHEQVELRESEFHHLVHVMRTRQGDEIELVNGKGALARATVQDLKKDHARLKIEQLTQEADCPCRLVLAQAIVKPQRLDFILEKGTELGVDQFWLFPGQYSNKKDFFPSHLERARSVTIAAMKQCGRLTLPPVIVQPSLYEWAPLENHSAFYGDVEPDAPLFETSWKNLKQPSFPIVFITGPEGGLSPQEIQTLKNQGVQGVKLHSHILRTETASLMALSLVSHWLLAGEAPAPFA